MTTIRIGVVFPATFNLNADAANAAVVARRLTLSGVDAEVVGFDIDSMSRGELPDALVIGSASSTALDSDDARSSIARDFVTRAHENRVPILAVTNGFHWLGTMTGKDGRDLGGLAIVPVHTTFGTAQHVTIGARVDTQWGQLVGVENHNATCVLGEGAPAFGTVAHGVGNHSGGIDGLIDDAVWATHLQGPVMALNPAFADAFASRVLARHGAIYRRGESLNDIDRLARSAAEHLVRKQSA